MTAFLPANGPPDILQSPCNGDGIIVKSCKLILVGQSLTHEWNGRTFWRLDTNGPVQRRMQSSRSTTAYATRPSGPPDTCCFLTTFWLKIQLRQHQPVSQSLSGVHKPSPASAARKCTICNPSTQSITRRSHRMRLPTHDLCDVGCLLAIGSGHKCHQAMHRAGPAWQAERYQQLTRRSTKAMLASSTTSSGKPTLSDVPPNLKAITLLSCSPQLRHAR